MRASIATGMRFEHAFIGWERIAVLPQSWIQGFLDLSDASVAIVGDGTQRIAKQVAESRFLRIQRPSPTSQPSKLTLGTAPLDS